MSSSFDLVSQALMAVSERVDDAEKDILYYISMIVQNWHDANHKLCDACNRVVDDDTFRGLRRCLDVLDATRRAGEDHDMGLGRHHETS